MSPKRPEQLKSTWVHSASPALFATFLAMAPGAALAIDLAFPGPAQPTAAVQEAAATFALPTGPWNGAIVPSRQVDGMVDRRAWRIEAPGLATLALMAPLRDQLVAAGFDTIFECETEACGGFDFRFDADLLPEPEMHVDLGDFRFLSAERGDEVIALMVSRSAMAGFVQATRVLPTDGPETVLAVADPAPVRMAPGEPSDRLVAAGGGATVSLSSSGGPTDLTLTLETTGRVVLPDLVFPIGASALAEGEYPSLAQLAGWLRDDPARRVALVGHTDASGGLDTNIVISQRRAASVRAELLGTYGVPASQVTAEGVGFLAPLASNATEEGRKANRRVEAVVTITP